jgi:hypothetical protein
LRSLVLTVLVLTLAACQGVKSSGDDTDTGTNDTETGSDTNACDVEDEVECWDTTLMTCEDGQWTETEECQDWCDPVLGCVLCPPGQPYCEGNLVMLCAPNGMSTSEEMDCAEWDTYCDDGACVFDDPCVQAMAEKSNVGCEYWAADLDNEQNSLDEAMGATGAGGQFAVVVANIGGDATAHVVVEINNAAQGDPLDLALVEEHDIDPLGLYIFRLPRRDVDGGDWASPHEWDDDGPQTQLSSLAFRVTSDVPVVAYQFNTLDQHYSNDATVLIPTSGLGTDHLVVGYYPNSPMDFPMSPKDRSYVTILGVEEGTVVDVTPTYDILNGPGVPEVATGIGILQGTTATFTIGPFDVLNLETRFMTTTSEPTPDLTGTRVHSDKPVVVYTGSDMISLAYIPDTTDFNACCAEHIEHAVFPSQAMGQKFVATHSAQRKTSGEPEYDFYRIIAYGTDGDTPTNVTTNLGPPDDAFALAPGEFREFFANTGFVVDADGPLHVAQFITAGTDVTPEDALGDPSLLFFPSVEQRRGLYVFTTGEGFDSNWAVISAAQGTDLHIDGADVEATCDGPQIDGTLDSVTYESWTCPIADGAHVVHSGPTPEEADYPIAVSVYGYYYAGSYAYTAGSDLRDINIYVPE